MATNSIDVFGIVQPETLAAEISRMYDVYKTSRLTWETGAKEVRDYLYAVDTNTTANITNPFSNRTMIPKLMQIAQNLHANYFEHMFSNPDYINWEAHNRESALEDKRKSIESYIRTKARQQNLTSTFSQLLWDWIIYGNCFSQLVYTNETKLDEETGQTIPGYVGPKLLRVSPHDIMFNPAASSWKQTPKIIRRVYSFGDIARMTEERPDEGWTQELFNKIKSNRSHVRNNAKQISNSEIDKTQGLVADGFSDLIQYYNSNLVEVLEFYGDMYDGEKGELLKDYRITVIDRAFIVRKEPLKSWTGTSYMYHDGWAQRPDNLYGMGPLDALVGMQYKIDKLENLRGDIFDQIAHPTTVETGDPEFFGVRGAPGGRYVVAEGGDVKYLAPDTTALQADFQIQQTMNDMELLAGSPKEAMGFRSPGEKTAFEVQTLDNAANRLFRYKVTQFEANVVEPILNDMLEMARRQLDGSDIIRAVDSTFGIEEFLEITKEDLTATGKLYPRGSQHFISQANMMQNLQTVFSSPVSEFIAPHISKVQLAKTVEDLLGVEQFSIVQENIGILEDVETQRIAQTGQQMLEEEAITDPREDVDAALGEAPQSGQTF
jgi:hypothetical protein